MGNAIKCGQLDIEDANAQEKLKELQDTIDIYKSKINEIITKINSIGSDLETKSFELKGNVKFIDKDEQECGWVYAVRNAGITNYHYYNISNLDTKSTTNITKLT